MIVAVLNVMLNMNMRMTLPSKLSNAPPVENLFIITVQSVGKDGVQRSICNIILDPKTIRFNAPLVENSMM